MPFPLDPVRLTRALVAIDSRNPALVSDGPGEAACAAFLAEVLEGWGFRVALPEAAPGRPNVVARIGPSGSAPLVLNGHLDVVGVDGMTHAPFDARLEDGSVYGRGSSDMKGGVAAMCVGAARAAAAGRLTSEVIVAAVCDEEHGSIGTRALLDGFAADGLEAAGAVITEPTRLAICPAHRGFVWVDARFRGRAAHGSRYELGVDANRHAGLFVAALDRHEREVLTRRTHPLLGRASLHVAMLSGGSGWSTYAEQSRACVERRTLPGETLACVQAEFEAVRAALTAEVPQLDLAMTFSGQPPLDLPVDAPLVRIMRAAVRAASGGRRDAAVEGLSCWTDAALFSDAGIPALCFGPGDIARAHSATEWVEVDQVESACATLEALCSAWGR
jgi:acetylornithine deacetylase